MSEPDHAISYKLLRRGTPVHSVEGEVVGTVAEVLDNPREHIFDGLQLDTPAGQRFVDAPEVARITDARVSLALEAAAVENLPDRDPAGGPRFRANPRGRRLGRFLGGGWRRDH